jgi:RimJ/RimL family protein N-acetyltransferase
LSQGSGDAGKGLRAIAFRPAAREDAERLFQWRNDAATRAASIQPGPVAWDVHLAWLERSLAAEDRRLLVAELDGAPIGTVRFDRQGAGWSMSWTVAPERRGQGLGGEMVRLAAENFGAPLSAVVLSANVASRKIAAAAGFVQVEKAADRTLWKHSGRPPERAVNDEEEV